MQHRRGSCGRRVGTSIGLELLERRRLLTAPAMPRLLPIGDLNVPYGDVVQFTAAGSDPDPTQTLTYSASSGTIDPKTGVYTSEHVTLGMTDLSVTITLSDSDSPPHTASQSFTIHPVYTNPIIVVNNHIYYGDLEFLDISVPAGQPMTLTGYVADSVADQPLTAVINLNDLASTGILNQRVPLNADGSFSLSHTYVTPRSFQVLLTVADGAGYKNGVFFNVTVTGSGTGVGGTAAPPVRVTSIAEKVVKNAISEFDVQFEGSVTGASNPANYHLAFVTTKKVRKHIVTVTKSIPIKKVIYDSAGDRARYFWPGGLLRARSTR